MRIRHLVFVSVTVAAFAVAGGPASALEARETRAQVILDVPNTWQVARQGEFVRAHPPDKSFEVSLAGTEHGPWQEAEAEKFLLDIVLTGAGRPHQELHVDTHARRVDWGNYSGLEVFGTGRMGNDYDTNLAPSKWFALVLVNKTTPSKGIYAVGIGSPAGYNTHEPGIYAAFHTLRSY